MQRVTCYISHQLVDESNVVKGGEMRDTLFAYICENYACKEPITDITKLKEQIDRLSGRTINAKSSAVTE